MIFILLRAQIVRLILGSGKFGWDDTKKTALTLGLFSISLIAQGLIPILARAFYALKNTRTPMYISIVTAIVSVAAAYPLSKIYGVAGLALAFSIGNFINAATLLIFLRKIYPDIWDKKVALSYLKIIFISLLMGLFVWLTIHVAAGFVNMNKFIGVFEQTLLALVVGFATYLGLSYIFSLEEMKWVVTRKINKS